MVDGWWLHELILRIRISSQKTCSNDLGWIFTFLPFPSQAQSSKLSLVWLYYQYKPPPPPPPPPPPAHFEPRALKPTWHQPGARFSYIWSQPGISLMPGWRQVKTLACRCRNPGQTKALCSWSKPDQGLPMPIPGRTKPLKLYSKLKPGNGTALSDFYYYYHSQYQIDHFHGFRKCLINFNKNLRELCHSLA